MGTFSHAPSGAKWLMISLMSRRPHAANSARTTSSGVIAASPCRALVPDAAHFAARPQITSVFLVGGSADALRHGRRAPSAAGEAHGGDGPRPGPRHPVPPGVR